MRATLAALLIALSAFPAPAAGAGALREASLASLLVRENPGEQGRRAALDLAFDAARPGSGGPEAVAGPLGGTRRNWFHRKPQDLPADAAPLKIPELPRAAAPAGFFGRAAAALGAALTPWRALADAAWGGTWTGMVSVGVAEHGR